MRLGSPQSIFNMGDTSIRVRQLVEVNQLILTHVIEYRSGDFIWEKILYCTKKFINLL